MLRSSCDFVNVTIFLQLGVQYIPFVESKSSRADMRKLRNRNCNSYHAPLVKIEQLKFGSITNWIFDLSNVDRRDKSDQQRTFASNMHLKLHMTIPVRKDDKRFTAIDSRGQTMWLSESQ